jgi:hypothetical protein
LDATELPGIVGHKCKLKGTGMRCNEEIVRADHRSTRFERGADLGIVEGCFVRKVQNLDVPQILIEGSMILLSSGRHFNPEEELQDKKKPNHYLDTEALNAAAAYLLNVHQLRATKKAAADSGEPAQLSACATYCRSSASRSNHLNTPRICCNGEPKNLTSAGKLRSPKWPP